MLSPAGGAGAPGARSPLRSSSGWYVRDVAASGAGSCCHRRGHRPLRRSPAPPAPLGGALGGGGGGERAPGRPRVRVRPHALRGGARRAAGRARAPGGPALCSAPSHALWEQNPPSCFARPSSLSRKAQGRGLAQGLRFQAPRCPAVSVFQKPSSVMQAQYFTGEETETQRVSGADRCQTVGQKYEW